MLTGEVIVHRFFDWCLQVIHHFFVWCLQVIQHRFPPRRLMFTSDSTISVSVSGHRFFRLMFVLRGEMTLSARRWFVWCWCLEVR